MIIRPVISIEHSLTLPVRNAENIIEDATMRRDVAMHNNAVDFHATNGRTDVHVELHEIFISAIL